MAPLSCVRQDASVGGYWTGFLRSGFLQRRVNGPRPEHRCWVSAVPVHHWLMPLLKPSRFQPPGMSQPCRTEIAIPRCASSAGVRSLT
jgi:hypothetical protein